MSFKKYILVSCASIIAYQEIAGLRIPIYSIEGDFDGGKLGDML